MTLSARKVGEGTLLLLVALMPFHAFFSVWIGSLFGHQAAWQAWKELVTLIVVAVAVWLVATEPKVRLRLREPAVLLGLVFGLCSLMVTLFTHPNLKATLLGVKTDLEFVGLFVGAIIIAGRSLKLKLTKAIIISSGAVIGFGLLQIFWLPKDFLSQFGYGAATIQPYLTVDPAIAAVRIVATLGGPNQLGSWLILPLSLVFALLLKRPRWWHPLFLGGGLVVMWGTYSRSAWLGLAVALTVVAIMSLRRRLRLPALLAATLVAALGLNLLINASGSTRQVQYYLFHATTTDTGILASTDQHSQALHSGVEYIKAQPLGHGLGSAGPASFYAQQPFIPESYYLQIGIEAGLLGLGLFLIFELMVALRLGQLSGLSPAAAASLGAMAGIAVINFFLHGWADSSTAIIYWVYAGAVIGASYSISGPSTKPKAVRA